jgi:hypothetical protein
MAKSKRGESQQNEDINKSEQQEPMDISGTGSNFEESDFVAVPDED